MYVYNGVQMHQVEHVCPYLKKDFRHVQCQNFLPALWKVFILARAQKEHHEKKERAKLARTQVDFVGSAAAKRPISAPTTNTGRATLLNIYAYYYRIPMYCQDGTY